MSFITKFGEYVCGMVFYERSLAAADIYICVYMCVCLCVCVCVCVCVCIYIYIYIHIYIYIYTNTHIIHIHGSHTHTCTCIHKHTFFKFKDALNTFMTSIHQSGSTDLFLTRARAVFLSHYLSSPLSHVQHHITIKKQYAFMNHQTKHFLKCLH